MKRLIIVIMLFATSFLYAQIEQDTAVRVNGGKIYGTLLLPKNSNKKTPVALIIAGSGPTDRNGNDARLGLNTNAYKMLADSLAKNGIASFRYDKRLAGESMDFPLDESILRFDDYVNDADSTVHFLQKKFSQIYILGHSEGSLIGILVAEKEKVAGYVSLAGAGENIAVTLKRQLTQMPDTTDVSRILSSLRNGKTVDSVPENLQLIFRSSVQPYLISWIKYDPQKEIAKLKCPVLILQGNHDIQVSVHDAENLKAGNPSATLKIIAGMNHVFKIAPSDRMQNAATYSNPDLPLNEELLTSIISFVKK